MKKQPSLSVRMKRKAVELYDGLIARVGVFGQEFMIIREETLELLSIPDSHLHVNQPSRIDMLKSIFKGTTKSSALYDLGNQFYVEFVIGDRGWKQSSLLDLYHGAHEEDWIEIADIADKAKGDKKRPTAKLVKEAIACFYPDEEEEEEEVPPKNSSKGKTKSASTAPKSAVKGGSKVKGKTDVNSKTELSVELELKKLEKFSRFQKVKTLNILKEYEKLDEPTLVAITLRSLSNDDQYKEVVAKLEKEV
jgi:hypothetical protein